MHLLDNRRSLAPSFDPHQVAPALDQSN